MSRPLLACLLALLLAPAASHAASAPDAGVPFEPAPESAPLYGTAAQTHQATVEGADGTDLFVETWLPAAKDGHEPPAKLPTILIMTPYVQIGVQRYPSRNLANVIEWFTARGYAVAQHHVRGTGSSGGCLEQTADNQIDDGARVVEYLGRDAPWASGAVGMYGISYDAETQISVAGRGDPQKTSYLKAIIPAETVAGQYEYSFMDGVPFTGQALLSNLGYLALTSLAPGEAPVDVHTFERLGCQGEIFTGSADQSGDMTPFWAVREYRPGMTNVRAATLWLHGLADWNVQPITMAASFDRLPAATPHKAIVGIWEHNYPDKHAGVEPDWARQDWLDVATAWYDRYLKQMDTGVEAWPEVQVQDSTGQWRSEPGWPWTGGPVGQLALGPEGALGTAEPTGSTAFREGPDDESAVFETPALSAPLHLTSQAVADLWLTSSLPDGHVTAVLQLIGADGEPLAFDGGQEVGTYGARSLSHLAPMPDGYFVQSEAEAPPTATPIRVPLRFQPTDFVVPAGAKLRLTVAGGTAWARETERSGLPNNISLLHDCEHTSALRFLMPRPGAPQLNVRETDEKDAPLIANPAAPLAVDAGGLAAAAVCGKDPERLEEFFGPERPDVAPGGTDGPAPAPAGTGPVHGAPVDDRVALAIAVDRVRLRTALRRGLRVRIRCTGACPALRLSARARGRRVTRVRSLPAATGRRVVRLRFTRAARRRIARSHPRRLRVTVRLTGAGRPRIARLTLR